VARYRDRFGLRVFHYCLTSWATIRVNREFGVGIGRSGTTCFVSKWRNPEAGVPRVAEAGRRSPMRQLRCELIRNLHTIKWLRKASPFSGSPRRCPRLTLDPHGVNTNRVPVSVPNRVPVSIPKDQWELISMPMGPSANLGRAGSHPSVVSIDFARGSPKVGFRPLRSVDTIQGNHDGEQGLPTEHCEDNVEDDFPCSVAGFDSPETKADS